MTPEEDGLWDELNHQQRREIDHHLRMGGSGRMSRSFSSSGVPRSLPSFLPSLPSLPVLRRVWQQTHDETSRLAQVFRGATVDAWKELGQQQQAYYAAGATASSSSRAAPPHHPQHPQQPNGYLRYFGIPAEDPRERHPYYVGDDTTTNSTPSSAEAWESFTGPGAGANDFVVLPPSQGRGHDWGAAANLDVFLSSLYQYYYHRGWLPILLKGVVELVGLFFTLTLSVFLFACVDWRALSDCTNESNCRPTLSDYLVEYPLQGGGAVWGTLVIVYALLFGAYGLFAVATFAHSLREASAAQWVFEERLGIDSRKLRGGAVDWDRDVVSKLVQLQRSGEYRIAIHGHDLDALIVAQRILRKENFLIALLNANVLDLTVPGWKGRTFFCSSIEWVLHFAVLNFMFNHKYHVRPAFYLDPAALRRRLVLCGMAHAIFLPFLLFFITLHFGFQNAYDWKSTKRYLGPREWSWHAKWQFREFNELPHHFEHRLAPSYLEAEEYLKLFGHSDVLKALGRVVVFVSGSLGAVLFVLAAMNDAILLHVKIADWNLLWYAGMVGVAYSIGKAMLPAEESVVSRNVVRNLYADADAALLRLSMHTHCYPEIWKNRGADAATYQAVSSMFQYKAKLFAMEVLSVIVAPVVLCVSLANCAERICEFVLLTKEEIPGAGEVCGFATFDFDKFSDLAWEGKTLGRAVVTGQQRQSTLVESLLHTGDVERATADLPRPKTRHGKMEKSFFSFKATHPSWKCLPSGQHLVDRVEQYEREETAALTREQQLHVEAAARQLETLARLEQLHIPPTSFQALDESYFPKPQPPADAGAGAGIRHRYVPPLHRTASDASPRREEGAAYNFEASPGDEDPLLPFATSSRQDSPNRMASTQLTHSPFFQGASTGLSTELRRVLNLSTLNLSTLDPDVSVTASALGIGGGVVPMAELNDGGDDFRAERQYLWLERYHAAAASAQQQQQQDRHPAASELRVGVPAAHPPEEANEPDHAILASMV